MVELIGAGVIDGAGRALSLTTLAYCLFGVTLGTLVGVLPGVGILASVALLMPLTYHLDPMTGIVMLAGIYYGAAYGGSTASILLNLPGTPNTAVTCLDGYPMARQGRAGVALFMTTIASFVGSVIGIALLAGFSIPLAGVALRFGAQEYFSLMVLGLVAASVMSAGGVLRSLAMVCLGLLLGLVGLDVNSGAPRFTFGVREFYDGMSLVAVALGLFGLSELMRNAGSLGAPRSLRRDISLRSMLPTREDWRRATPAMLRGSGVGAFFGALPGTGSMIASFVAYAMERRVSRHPAEFGKGAIEGISAPESANNAAIQTAFIPTLTLGIPGDAVMALVLAVFLIHGIIPGPQLISGDPGLFWGLIISFLVGNVMLLVLNIPLIGVWIRILTIPYSVMFPAIVGFLCIGVYSLGQSVVDLLVLAGFGLAGYLFHILRFPIAPLIVAMVLGPMMEENFRRAMLFSRGDPMTFLDRPISAGFLLTTLAMLVAFLVIDLRAARRRRSGHDAA